MWYSISTVNIQKIQLWLDYDFNRLEAWMYRMQPSFWRCEESIMSSHDVPIRWLIFCKNWNSLKKLSYFDAFYEHTQILVMHEGISMLCNTRKLFGSSIIGVARITYQSAVHILFDMACSAPQCDSVVQKMLSTAIRFQVCNFRR